MQTPSLRLGRVLTQPCGSGFWPWEIKRGNCNRNLTRPATRNGTKSPHRSKVRTFTCCRKGYEDVLFDGRAGGPVNLSNRSSCHSAGASGQMLLNLKKLAPIAVGAWFLLCAADAGTIVYEGFNYPVGASLPGQSGGTGWTGAWIGPNLGGAAANGTDVPFTL